MRMEGRMKISQNKLIAIAEAPFWDLMYFV